MKESKPPLENDAPSLAGVKKEFETLLAREREVSRLKGQMVSIASHEFRTPLSSIQLSASMIEHYFDRLDRAKIFHHLKKIIQAVQDMTAVLDDILSLEKIDSGKIPLNRRHFDLASLGREILDEMQGLTKKNQHLQHRHDGKESSVYLDQNLVRHCITNLISNAIKYSPEAGVIELITGLTERFIDIQVKDDGIDIPENEQVRLFETFFRASNVKAIQGTGLGLSIVKRYVELMEGSVSFTSTENKETIFKLRFPRGMNDRDQPIK